MKRAPLLGLSVCTFFLLFGGNAAALTPEELHNDATLTPDTFAPHFAKFKFVFNADVQKPAEFLATEAGDCDDYATLAAAELAARGYHPRLVSVRLKNVVHVVCYVSEATGYLDYNLRARASGMAHCGPELSDIADSVAKSFKSTWNSASEFTYNDSVKRLVLTAWPKDRPPKTTVASK
jgi:hypothetical protein